MVRCLVGFLLVAALALACRPVAADDKWELALIDDDTVASRNCMRAGTRQTHDLEGLATNRDRDWIQVAIQPGHSYEARISEKTMGFNPPNGSCAPCGDFDLVDGTGAVLIPADFIAADTYGFRWIKYDNFADYVRVRGSTDTDFGPYEEYTLEFFDSTYTFARWNNSSTQVTVLLVRNNTWQPVDGEIYFYDPAGALLHTEPLSLPAHGLQAVLTAGIPALAGVGGSGAIVHLGGYGALSGKSVAVEPGTGFTFDTPLEPIPQ